VSVTSIPGPLARELHRASGASTWSIPLETFTQRLIVSASARFATASPSPRDVEEFLRTLHLSDLALACACASGHDAAWEHFVGEMRPALYAAARTMARPDYSALGGSITADDTTHTGNGGNPNLKPIRSTNLDASIEWYYAPRSLVSAALYYLDLTNYVAFGTYETQLFDIRNNRFATYTISAPTNSNSSRSSKRSRDSACSTSPNMSRASASGE